MKRNLSRLFRPKTIAVVGGGAWCAAVIQQLIKMDFGGQILPVHPNEPEICNLKSYPNVDALEVVPDAVFIGINRDATIKIVDDLSRLGAGGAVCFASGFGETTDGQDANQRLLEAASEMPILGPNCYGMINAVDGISLWPDQHGCDPVESGVAILTQSSNIAINLTMQKRGLPIAYVVACGNQAQLSEAEIADALLDDPRVTAIGLHIEGLTDLNAWQSLARKADAKGVPLVALKVGRSKEARNATISHTASLAGSDAGAQALLDHLGIARVDDLPTLIETLKVLHMAGPLASSQIASISCSGGEASLIADMAHGTGLTFPPLTEHQRNSLYTALGPKVALANPLDYHTYIWRDTESMALAFSAMLDTHLAVTFLIVDFPRDDKCDDGDWDCAIDAALAARSRTGQTIAMVATLPELMPEHVAKRLMEGGVIPLNGLAEALSATQAAQKRSISDADLIIPTSVQNASTLSEFEAKTALSQFGLSIPMNFSGHLEDVVQHADQNDGPFVLKTIGQAHKSETGGVALSLSNGDEVRKAAEHMEGDSFLIEEMVEGAVAEILVGIFKDPAHGFVITLAAGGILTELLQDSVSILLPTTKKLLKQTLSRLKIAPILSGYRGQPCADIEALLDAIEAILAYVLANLDTVEEVEVNPLIVTPTRAVAADALIRKRHD